MEKVIQLFILTWKLDKKFVCFDVLVVGASSSAPEAELITTKCQKKKFKLNVEELFPANFFWVSLNIKSDPKTPTNI